MSYKVQIQPTCYVVYEDDTPVAMHYDCVSAAATMRDIRGFVVNLEKITAKQFIEGICVRVGKFVIPTTDTITTNIVWLYINKENWCAKSTKIQRIC